MTDEKIPGETGYYVAPTGNNPDRESGWRWFPEYKDNEHKTIPWELALAIIASIVYSAIGLGVWLL